MRLRLALLLCLIAPAAHAAGAPAADDGEEVDPYAPSHFAAMPPSDHGYPLDMMATMRERLVKKYRPEPPKDAAEDAADAGHGNGH